jgi:hypothetical protein
MNQDNQNEIFTLAIKAGASRIYYLNVKTDRNGETYLIIKESKKEIDGTKQIHRIMVFEKDLDKFAKGLQDVLSFINQRNPRSKNLSQSLTDEIINPSLDLSFEQ